MNRCVCIHIEWKVAAFWIDERRYSNQWTSRSTKQWAACSGIVPQNYNITYSQSFWTQIYLQLAWISCINCFRCICKCANDSELFFMSSFDVLARFKCHCCLVDMPYAVSTLKIASSTIADGNDFDAFQSVTAFCWQPNWLDAWTCYGLSGQFYQTFFSGKMYNHEAKCDSGRDNGNHIPISCVGNSASMNSGCMYWCFGGISIESRDSLFSSMPR